MKKVAILAAVGLLSLLVFACGVEKRPEPYSRSVPPAAPLLIAPIVLVDEEIPGKPEVADEVRVISPSERRTFIREGRLPEGNPGDQIVEYTLYSRSAPMKHYKLRRQPQIPREID